MRPIADDRRGWSSHVVMLSGVEAGVLPAVSSFDELRMT